MKRISCVTTLLLAILSAPAQALSFLEARHLLNRTGFSPSLPEINMLLPLTREEAVDAILNRSANPHVLEVPKSFSQKPNLPGKNAAQSERKAFQEAQRKASRDLQLWWFEQMVVTRTPFAEQMTLFWHNHFVSSLQKVKLPYVMFQQNELFRRQGLGNFKDLVLQVSQDPAMIIYLDNQSNKKSAPNENYARELMELFTLGEGHYTEEDIQAAARAFTGWQVDRQTGSYFVNRRHHDTGRKTFFAQEGHWNGDDIVDLIFSEKPELVAQRIVQKFWQHFVSLTPSESEEQRLSLVFQKHDFELKPLIRALLLSESFWQQKDAPNLIKSPVDLVVGTQRSLGLTVIEPSLVRQMGKNMGQMLFAPPNVKGWPGGEHWINSTTLVARMQTLGGVTRIMEKESTNKMAMNGNVESEKVTGVSWQMLLLGPFADLDNEPQGSTNNELDATEISLQQPAYQLK